MVIVLDPAAPQGLIEDIPRRGADRLIMTAFVGGNFCGGGGRGLAVMGTGGAPEGAHGGGVAVSKQADSGSLIVAAE